MDFGNRPMAHEPQHPDNPCALGLDEQNPAKIWELLRRNGRFQKAVERLIELDKRPAPESFSVIRAPSEIGYDMVGHLAETNGFASVALKWLVPEPVFEVRHVEIRANLDLTGRKYAPLTNVKLELGTTADPTDVANWRVFEAVGNIDGDGVANISGRKPRRGPVISVNKSSNPKFCSQIDHIQEWREYFSNGRKFTLATPSNGPQNSDQWLS